MNLKSNQCINFAIQVPNNHFFTNSLIWDGGDRSIKIKQSRFKLGIVNYKTKNEIYIFLNRLTKYIRTA